MEHLVSNRWNLSTLEELEGKLNLSLEEIGQQKKQIDGLLQTSKVIPTCETFTKAARKVFDVCKELTGATSGYIALLSENGEENEVLFLDAGDLSCTVDPSLPMPIRGLRSLAYRDKDVVYDNQFSTSRWLEFLPAGHVTIENVLFAPLVIQDRAVGLMGLANKPGGFTERDKEIARSFGDLAVVALTYAEYREELKESEERLQIIFDNAPAIMFLQNRKGEVLKINKTALNRSGKTLECIQGNKIGNIMNCIGSLQHPNGCGYGEMRKECVLWQTIEETFRTNQNIYKVEAVWGLQDKDTVENHTILISTSFIDQGNHEVVLVTIDDITDRKQAEESLKESEQLLRKIAENFPNSYLSIIEKDFTVGFTSGQEFMKRNLDPSHFIGLTLEQVFGDNSELVKEYYQKTFKGQECSFELRIDGQYQQYRTVPLVSQDGSVQRILSVVENITERKLAETALKKAHDDLEFKVKERTAELRLAKEEAEAANRAKTAFLANISHELRNPMHHILSYSKSGLEKLGRVKEERIRHYFKQIRTSGSRLLLLLNDLLDLAKMEAGRMEYHLQLTSLWKIAFDVKADFEVAAAEKGVMIILNDPKADAKVRCDEHKIGQVLRNLLSNAIKFTPRGNQISILIEPGKLQQENPTKDALKVSVCDQGSGIPESDLETIFDKFTQSKQNKGKSGGTGLGLSICREIVKAHMGRIWAENNKGMGATFSFLLPYE